MINTWGDYASGTVAHVPRKALYQVDFRLADAPGVTSAQFDYRHGR